MALSSATARTPRRWPRGQAAGPPRRCARLKQQEDRIEQLIQEAIRKARERARRKAAREARKANHGGPPVETNGLLLHPVNGPVTSPFGYRMHPIYHYWGLHDGDDFGAPLRRAAVRRRRRQGASRSTTPRSGATGSTSTSAWSTASSSPSIYNHLSGYNVGVGATVGRGDVVGYVGTTGWSTGCHLHFTVMVNGTPVDPMNWL